MSQEEIVTNTKTVVQGLEALKNEITSILNGLASSLEPADEKAGLVRNFLDTIELGLGEAQVRTRIDARGDAKGLHNRVGSFRR